MLQISLLGISDGKKCPKILEKKKNIFAWVLFKYL